MVSAITMTYAEEAIGIASAAAAAGIPAAISFTVETDGRLPSGQALGDAIEQVDAETLGSPAYYMVNCAHPSHFAGVVADGGAWRDRIAGLRANASAQSHAELDAAEELDEGDPVALGADYVALRAHLPAVTVLGGCCGTDARHVAAVGAAWAARGRQLSTRSASVRRSAAIAAGSTPAARSCANTSGASGASSASTSAGPCATPAASSSAPTCSAHARYAPVPKRRGPVSAASARCAWRSSSSTIAA